MNISESTRQNIIDYLLMRDHPFHGKMGVVQFLNRIWNLSSLPSTDPRFQNMEGDVNMHMVSFNDWTNHNLLYDSRLNLLRGTDNVFIKFIENCVHPLVIYRDEHQDELVARINDLLNNDNVQLEISSDFDGKSVYEIKSIQIDLEGVEGEYEVVLSFAGENRDYVEDVAKYLTENNVRIFYDFYEEDVLWGKELTECLDKIYGGDARYCVMFISKYYVEKIWTIHERRSAFARALTKDEYILPARFDDTEISGLRSTIGHVDISRKTPEELGKLILKKLGKSV